MLTNNEIETAVRSLLKKYHAESAVLFGSYARGDATPQSDLDVIVFGGVSFKKVNIFAFAEELREMTGKDVDAFEISEIDTDTDFYHSLIREGIKIA